MKFLKKILVFLLLLVVIFVVGSFFISKDFSMTHEQTIKAKMDDVFKQINTPKAWKNWSYWNKLDTTMTVTYNDIADGKGASYSWNSKDKMVGNGSFTITASEPNKKIDYDLVFGGIGGSSGSYLLSDNGDGSTKVISTFKSTMNGMLEKWMKVLFMKSSMNKAFTESLNNMETYIAKQPSTDAYSLGNPEETNSNNMIALTIREKCTPNDLTKAFEKNLGKLATEAKAQNLNMIAPPFAIYHYWDTTMANQADIEFGIVVDKLGKENNQIKSKEIKANKIAKIAYFGDYTMDMKHAYQALEKYIQDNKLTIIGAPYEVYVTDPASEPDKTKWQTDIYFPIK